VGDEDTSRQEKTGGPGRRWLWLVLFLVLTALVSSRFTTLKQLANTLSNSSWQWTLVGLLVHGIYFYFYAVFYRFGLDTVGVSIKAFRLLPVVIASIFVNSLAPTGGAGGGALLVNYAVNRGQSGARTAVGLVLILLSELLTLIPFVFAGAYYLYLHQRLAYYDTAAGIVFLLFIAFLIILIVLAGWRTETLERFLNWVRKIANRIALRLGREPFLEEDWARRNQKELSQAANAIAANPKQLGLLAIWGLWIHAVNAAGLYAFFLAFRQPVDLGVLVAGFSFGIVFFVVSIIPQGVGAVEGIMALVFTSMGVPDYKAIAIALSFRGANFWLPVVVGMLVIRPVLAPTEEL
jgi:uncharacterized protein (TIRG00374 family)